MGLLNVGPAGDFLDQKNAKFSVPKIRVRPWMTLQYSRTTEVSFNPRKVVPWKEKPRDSLESF